MEAITNDPRWPKLVARDKGADGTFFYSVATTGVYCRPSCGARTPLPKNVAFYETAGAAERAGFRACKRCKPDVPGRPHGALVASLCRWIEEAEAAPTLDELAARAGLSPFHLHRVFKEVTGLTPRSYASAQRAKKVRASLESGGSVTRAVYDAGYGSSSRFYETSNARLGMTPRRWQRGGVDTRIRFAVGECSLGSILVAASDRGVCAIALGDDPETLTHAFQDRFPRAELVAGDRAFEGLVASVVGWVDAPKKGLELPLDVRGTAFQQRVWEALRRVPFGQTRSYAELAEMAGAASATRAVARACANNPIAIAIPCHRIIQKSGQYGGYRWGIERKRALLEGEAKA